MRYVSGTKLDERIIRCDLDLGYKEGRQFGRGKSGGQVRDEHRQDYDPGRGGWGAQAQRIEIERRREVEERYADAQEGPGAVAGGGGDWKQEDNAGADVADKGLKRGRSPDDEGDTRTVGEFEPHPLIFLLNPSFYRDKERKSKKKSKKTWKRRGCNLFASVLCIAMYLLRSFTLF
jgi:hypothetical protein